MKWHAMKTHGAVLLAAIALASCSNGNSSATPSATSAPSNATSSVVTVLNSGGTPVAGIAVTLSKAIVNGIPENVLAHQTTNSSGTTTFSSLPSTGELCVSAGSAGKCKEPFPASISLQF